LLCLLRKEIDRAQSLISIRPHDRHPLCQPSLLKKSIVSSPLQPFLSPLKDLPLLLLLHLLLMTQWEGEGDDLNRGHHGHGGREEEEEEGSLASVSVITTDNISFPSDANEMTHSYKDSIHRLEDEVMQLPPRTRR
jgi:hypothetical protein